MIKREKRVKNDWGFGSGASFALPEKMIIPTYLTSRSVRFFYLPMQSVQNRSNRPEEIFSCKRCGFCCQGETTVSLNEDDQARMVAFLGLSREEVQEKYWRVTNGVVQMKTVAGHCIFYDENRGCTVHGGRPWRCGQWPLHPSILRDRNNFATIRSSCPGLNAELSYEEFCIRLRQLLDETDSLMF